MFTSLYDISDETDDDQCIPVLYKLIRRYGNKVTITTDFNNSQMYDLCSVTNNSSLMIDCHE